MITNHPPAVVQVPMLVGGFGKYVKVMSLLGELAKEVRLKFGGYMRKKNSN